MSADASPRMNSIPEKSNDDAFPCKWAQKWMMWAEPGQLEVAERLVY